MVLTNLHTDIVVKNIDFLKFWLNIEKSAKKTATKIKL